MKKCRQPGIHQSEENPEYSSHRFIISQQHYRDYRHEEQTKGVVGLRHVRVHIPLAVKEGETAVLLCFFDLEGDSLYSVKWYKGGREIFRYIPRDTPSIKIFPIPGLEELHIEGIKRLYPQHFDRKRELRKLNHSLLVNFLDLLDLLVKCPESPRRAEKVEDLSLLFIHIHHLLNEFRPHQARETLRVMMDLQKRQRMEISQRFQKHLDKKSKSNATHLYLKKVTKSLKGRYSCEVSADAPSFQTALYSGDMNVVIIPTTLPEVQLTKSKYRIGETLKAECTSKDSRPPANLTWGLNGQTLDSEYVKKFAVRREPETNLETAISTLSLVVERHHFSNNGRLKLRCTASIHNVYWRTTERSAEENRPKVVDAAQVRKPTELLSGTTPVPSRSSRTIARWFSFGDIEPLILLIHVPILLCSLML